MLENFLWPRAMALAVCAGGASIIAVGCSRDEAPSAAPAVAPECDAYFAAFDRCFEAQGPEAKAATQRALAAARADVALAGAQRASRCRDGLRRVTAAC